MASHSSNANNNQDSEDDQLELLMRHSSPLVSPDRRQSPLTVRNSSPSFLASRPRSNQRNRTPMRFESPLNADAFRIPEENEHQEQRTTAATTNTNEGRRISILPMAGSARGTNVANFRNRHETSIANKPVSKSRKQGPSHRKVRRWNNDNFINLAQEVGRSSSSAANALVKGHANASKYRSIYDPNEHKHESNVMNQLVHGNDKKLRDVRDKFFKGELHSKPEMPPSSKKAQKGPLTSEQMMNRIEKRLRRVVVRAIENSYPATKVMETLEDFLFRAYNNNGDIQENDEVWKDILVVPPTVSKHDDTESPLLVIRFLFDKESSTGGFHRLLLHALVQFHGLSATSSTTAHGRLLTATGKMAGGAEHKLVDYIMQKKEERLSGGFDKSKLDVETNRLAALKV